jgi:cellulose synthase/poly-beta-1,6-N-acetylglucosamine synthase-like glycosyltransferase
MFGSAELIFFILLFLVVYTYLIYPVVIKLISLFSPLNLSGYSNHSVSVLISAFNEERVIEERIRNISEQKIDFSLLEVLVGSDGSTDATNEIILKLQQEYTWLKVFIYKKQRGKAIILNDLVDKAQNKILVFTDANTIFNRDSIVKLTGNFYNETIGGVSGRLILVDLPTSSMKGIKEKDYWEYETFIKKSEGRCGFLIGANGGIFAIRKKLYLKMPPDKAVTDDLFITLSVLSKNQKFIYQYDAVAKEEVAPDIKSEFRRKIRFAATNFQTLVMFKQLLFSKNFLLSFAFWSHKVIRWIVPLVLILLISLNVLLMTNSNFFEILFIIQIAFYSTALLGFIFSLVNINLRIFSLISYFVLTNLALLLGLIKYLSGKHSAIWDSTPR